MQRGGYAVCQLALQTAACNAAHSIELRGEMIIAAQEPIPPLQFRRWILALPP